MFNSRFITGLDLGAANIKLAVLKNKHIIETIIEDIPFELRFNEEQKISYTTEILKKLLSQKTYFKNSSVLSTISRSVAIIKYITLPSQDKTEIASMLPFEIERHIPLSLDSIIFDYRVLEGRSEGNKNTSEVMVVVVKKDIVGAHLKVLAAAGLKPERIELSSLALCNSFRRKFPEEKETVSLLDIGAQNTEINILADGLLKFSRSVVNGGDTLNQLLQKEFDIELNELEDLKKSGRIFSELKAPFVISEWIELLSAEVNQSWGAFRDQGQKNIISKIYLTGGGSKLAGLTELLEKKLSIPAYNFNPFPAASDKTSESNREQIPFFAVAMGLASYGAYQKKGALNLLPAELKKSKEESKRKKIFLSVAGLGVLVFLILGLIGYLDIAKKQKQIQAVEQELKARKKEIDAVKELQLKIQLLQDKSNQNEIFLEALRQISLIVPANICIDRLVFDKETAVLLRGKTDSHSAVASFSIALEKSRYFEKVVNKGSHEDEFGSLKLIEFEIECRLKKPQWFYKNGKK